MQATPKGRANGIAFTAGWLVLLAVLVTVVVLAGSGGDALGNDDGAASWTLWLKLGLGVLFLLMDVKHWQDRPREGRAAGQPGRRAG
ncbi:GAP family protein [Streptomyces aquilus]|uniref:GAP family protein n=1 Tax=Streptomyces aquilus TaxID=2548456 RepID=UPI001416EF21|nr:GAP family protein [Streptomyces aquilus]